MTRFLALLAILAAAAIAAMVWVLRNTSDPVGMNLPNVEASVKLLQRRAR
jgi:hypothetical protein